MEQIRRHRVQELLCQLYILPGAVWGEKRGVKAGLRPVMKGSTSHLPLALPTLPSCIKKPVFSTLSPRPGSRLPHPDFPPRHRSKLIPGPFPSLNPEPRWLRKLGLPSPGSTLLPRAEKAQPKVCFHEAMLPWTTTASLCWSWDSEVIRSTAPDPKQPWGVGYSMP